MSDEHPNVVRCFAMEEDREFVYLALERCRSTLNDFLGTSEGREAMVAQAVPGRPGPTARCIEIMEQVASGLAALHEVGGWVQVQRWPMDGGIEGYRIVFKIRVTGWMETL